jgi:hypothetical protein
MIDESRFEKFPGRNPEIGMDSGERRIDSFEDSEELTMLRQITAELAIALTKGENPLLQPEDVEALIEETEMLKEYRRHQATQTGEYRNPNVPWSDSLIPYHCVCGKITYSDTACDCKNSHYGPYSD